MNVPVFARTRCVSKRSYRQRGIQHRHIEPTSLSDCTSAPVAVMKVNVMQFGVCGQTPTLHRTMVGCVHLFTVRSFATFLQNTVTLLGPFTLYLNRKITHLRALTAFHGRCPHGRYNIFVSCAHVPAGCSDDDSKQSAVLILNDEHTSHPSRKPEARECSMRGMSR